MHIDLTFIYLMPLHKFFYEGVRRFYQTHRVHGTENLRTPDLEELRRIAKTLSPLS